MNIDWTIFWISFAGFIYAYGQTRKWLLELRKDFEQAKIQHEN